MIVKTFICGLGSHYLIRRTKCSSTIVNKLLGRGARKIQTERMFDWSPHKSKRQLIASIDQGTSSSRFMVFDKQGTVVANYQQEHKQYHPKASWVEHDPEEIWQSVKKCINYALYAGAVTKEEIVSLGITNQRETTVIWSKLTGKPYHNAIVWNDTRTTSICEELEAAGHSELIRTRTGIPLSTYSSGSKIMYLLREVPELKEAVDSGEAIFGTIDTWLLFKLTGGKEHKTDVTNASRTMLMDLEKLDWDPKLMSILGVRRSLLPEICSSSEVYGEVAADQADSPLLGGCNDLEGVPIAGILGDQHAALVGQVCFQKGEVKCTYGTGAFMMMNTGEKPVPSNSGLVTTVGYKLGKDAPCIYALEGSVAYCGSLIQWLRDHMELFSDAAKSEILARSVEDNGGVYFVPAFSGLFAPYWRSDARGVITGLTAFNTKAHITRAALEAAAFQVTELIVAMEADAGISLPSLKVDGGMTKNKLLMQFQSDLINCPMTCPQMAETTAIGSAYAAALAVGFYTDIEDVKGNWRLDSEWQPSMDATARADLLRNWRKAVARAVGWVENDTPQSRRVNDDLISSLTSRGSSTYTFTVKKEIFWGVAIAAVAGIAAIKLQFLK